MTEQNTLPVYGARVIYHGSITGAHGAATYLGHCGCSDSDCYGFLLESDNGHELDHVRRASFTTQTQEGSPL